MYKPTGAEWGFAWKRAQADDRKWRSWNDAPPPENAAARLEYVRRRFGWWGPALLAEGLMEEGTSFVQMANWAEVRLGELESGVVTLEVVLGELEAIEQEIEASVRVFEARAEIETMEPSA
jgi:hypothetical protein